MLISLEGVFHFNTVLFLHLQLTRVLYSEYSISVDSVIVSISGFANQVERTLQATEEVLSKRFQVSFSVVSIENIFISKC